MDKYINRGAALKDICVEEERAKQFRCPMGADRASFIAGMLTAFGLARNIVGRQKTADVATVRHGRWIVLESYRDGGTAQRCSECRELMYFYRTTPRNHCPNCGAKMDGGDA